MIRNVSSLHNHTCLSFSDGVSSPEELVRRAKELGLRSVALTDHGHCHAHARFFLEGKKLGVRTILGMEAYVIHSLGEWREMKEKLALAKKKDAAEVEFDLDRAVQDKTNRKVLYRKGHLVLLAQNRTGLANLYRLQYRAHKEGYFQKPRIDKRMLAEHSEGLVASSACMGGIISQKLWGVQRGDTEWSEVVREVEEFKEIFPGRFFLELQSNEAEGQKFINEHLIRLHFETGVPLDVTMDSHYIDPEDWRSQQILHMLLTHRGNKEGLTMNNLPSDYSWNVKSLFLKNADALWDSFKAYNPEVSEGILENAFENTLLIDSLIDDFEPDTTMRLPSLPYKDTFQELLLSSREGLKARGLEGRDEYIERLGYELGVIKEKGLANYFLVVRNIVESARKEMLIGPGRGSAAGSLICYLTGITNIDPIEHGLMFERFINLDRVETPDIDLDFQDVDRVKDILRRDFGEDNVACISTYGTNQIKGLLKDVGRVHGIDYREINTVNAKIDIEMKALYGEGETKSAISIKLEDVYRLSPTFRDFIARYPHIERDVKSIYGREHHVGRHASGVVIGDDLPSETSIFVSKGVVQASFTDGIVNKSASNMGLVKFDILGLATLEVISKCCHIISRQHGIPYDDVLALIDPKKMNFDDQKIMRDVFWSGNMTGIFQVTSSGMAKLFQQVKPSCFNDVAATAALYRPGPLGSKMDQMYANRKNGIEKVEYEHPLLEKILGETYGVYVYQEQVLELCRLVAGMSWKDTNRVRKLRLKKDKSKSADFIAKEEAELRELFVTGLEKNGLDLSRAEQLWKDLEAWGSYGFNVAHAKSYGMVTMQTAYLRTYYPIEFFAALLSVGQAAALQTYVNDIRRQGFDVLPVDVNASGLESKVENNAIRLAFTSVKGIGDSAAQKIVRNQPYSSFEDFLTRSETSKTIVEALIWVGGFVDLCPDLSYGTLAARHELYRSDKTLSHKKNRDLLPSVMARVPHVVDDRAFLMKRERELLNFNIRDTPFSINGRFEKIDRLVEQEICLPDLEEFLSDEEMRVVICPTAVTGIELASQKNGKEFARLTLSDRNGSDLKVACFANIWEHVRDHVKLGEVYVTIAHRREDDPRSFIAGRVGWKQSQRSSLSSFILLDSLEV